MEQMNRKLLNLISATDVSVLRVRVCVCFSGLWCVLVTARD